MKSRFDSVGQEPPKSKAQGAWIDMVFSKIKVLFLLLCLSLGSYAAIAQTYDNPLLQSVAEGDTKRFDELMRRPSAEFAVRAADLNGVLPLHLAAEHGDVHMVKALLDKKASPDRMTQDGGTPIALAIKNKHYEVVRMLLEKKPAVFSASNTGQNGLHLLAAQMLETPQPFESEAAKLFLELVRAGADHSEAYIDPQNDQSIMPLTLLGKKISPKSPEFLKFSAAADQARKEARAALGFGDENSVITTQDGTQH